MTMMLRRALMEPAGGGELYPVGTDLLAGAVWTDKKKYDDSTGELVANGSWSAIEAFFQISPDYRYQITETSGGNIYYYDQSGVYISSEAKGKNRDLVIPSNAVKIHFCTYTSRIDTITLVRIA